MKFASRFAIGAFAAALAAPVFAQQQEGLSGKVAFGYLATSGNSDNENMNLSFSGKKVSGNWTHALDGQAVKSSTNSVTTAQAYGLGWQSQYDFSEHNFVFGLVDWDKDEFSAYDQQTREVVGYGRRIIGTEKHVLNGQAGIGARQADLRDGTSEDDTIARLGLDYEWQISDTAKFNQTFSVESGSNNTYTESMSSLSADVWGNFAIVLSYTIKQNSTVPAGVAKRDTFTAISLEYSF